MACASPVFCKGEDTRALYEVTTDCTACRVPETLPFCPTCTGNLRKLLNGSNVCELCLERNTVQLVRIVQVKL